MTIKIGQDRRFIIGKNLIMMLVMVVLIILAIMAWFVIIKTVSANGIRVKAISSDLSIAECIKDGNGHEGPGVFKDSLTFENAKFTKDCTGNGETLIVPEFNVIKDPELVRDTGKEVNENLTPANADSQVVDPDDYEFLEYEFYIRSKGSSINLSADSQLISQTEASNGNLSDSPSPSKKSAYGNFNVDALVGAMRVSLIGQGASNVTQTWSGQNVTAANATLGTAVKQILWLPRPDIKLNVSNTGKYTDWTITTGVPSGSTYQNTYYKRKESPNTGVELVTDNDSKTKVSSNTYQGVKCLGQTVNITDFDYTTTTSNLVKEKTNTNVKEDYFVTKYIMRIWIEGTDSEARRAMDGGNFNMVLKFS